ncbi:alpha-E domain-containing protein [Terasakiella sp. A23]|uniref:alpha-E domain-containing protein n=1 Tax=Terasakiella sp. FCG-A23 TaxID=3080561 RepID=UPI0029533FF7|nr:alpha-E domain-containing protein [Terasakiella sp. A23]MDV7341522.1 alpha-E domain-containing protein [Terasakiella sp. A23]
MLGRAADNLYWMARNMERIENIVRLIKTSRTANMLSENGQQSDNIWEMPLEISGQRNMFMEDYGEVSDGRVSAFMLSDTNNPVSVKTLLSNARENARATRHLLTSDVWECINRTWLSVKDLNYQDIVKSSLDDHLEWMIDRSYMFKGVMAGSMRRGEGLQFANLGLAVERADYSARLLMVHFATAEKNSSQMGGMQVRDYYRSMVILNALNAYKAYRETFHSSIELDKIAELVILHKEVPRSLRASVDEIVEVLRTLNPTASVMKEVYDLQYRLETVQIAQLRRVGLDHFLIDFSKNVDEISLNIQHDFMMVQ